MAGTIHDGHVTVAVRRSVSMESGLEGRNNLWKNLRENRAYRLRSQ